MNILIVCPFYKQDKNIASVRWTNLAARLSKNHNVTVVSQPFDDTDTAFVKSVEDGITVARINQKTAYEMTAIKHFGGSTGDDWQTKSSDDVVAVNDNIIRKLKNIVLFSSMRSKARKYASEICKKVIPKGQKIDVVITSACPVIEMVFGYELKKRLKCKWISDFRDLPFTIDDCDSTHRTKALMKKCLKVADSIVIIAPQGRQVLEKGIVDDPAKIHVITNGFSIADKRVTRTIDDGVLHIVHTGSLYGGSRKADMLFKAVLEAKIKDPKFKCVLECAGGNSESLLQAAEKYGLDKTVVNRGFIPREQALDMQCSADILLALVFYQLGSLSAKLFEYILNKKPVVCITCGDKPNGEDTVFVRDLNLGIAVEEVNEQTDLPLLADYLLNQWKRKKNNEKLLYQPNEEMIKKYDHDSLVEQFENLF